MDSVLLEKGHVSDLLGHGDIGRLGRAQSLLNRLTVFNFFYFKKVSQLKRQVLEEADAAGSL